MKNEKHNLWVIGDSTLSSFADQYYYPRYGYGTMLEQYLDQMVDVKNIALSGRSSKSYTKEPEYKVLLDGMKKGDFLIIGFGHNDEKTEEDRYTDPNGDVNTAGSFANSLYQNYIKYANEAGCQTILCTPIVRRTKTGSWTKQELHQTDAAGDFAGGDYAQAVKNTGKELGIPVVDMTQITKALYDEMGPDETVHLHAWPSDKEISVDNTHTNIWGARVNAYLVLSQIQKLNIAGLSEHIVISSDQIPSKDQYLVSNPEYKPTVYTRDLRPSKLWEEIDGFHGTVFGDIGNVPDQKKFTLEKDQNGDFHMAVRQNTGKISAVSDGIAMYYQMIPVTENFVLTANVRINDYFSNDQVSFGLMVRDDCYIDQVTSDILGDYVAAAPLLLTHGKDAWNCFARKSGVLTKGGLCTRAYQPGDVVALRIESTTDGYACTFGEEQTITGGFDFKLTSIDPEYVYAGMFVSRNADVTFSDVKLEIR